MAQQMKRCAAPVYQITTIFEILFQTDCLPEGVRRLLRFCIGLSSCLRQVPPPCELSALGDDCSNDDDDDDDEDDDNDDDDIDDEEEGDEESEGCHM